MRRAGSRGVSKWENLTGRIARLPCSAHEHHQKRAGNRGHALGLPSGERGFRRSCRLHSAGSDDEAVELEEVCFENFSPAAFVATGT